MSIETIYRARIELDFDDYGSVADLAFELEDKKKGLDVTLTDAGPAWDAYVICEGPDLLAVKDWHKAVSELAMRAANLHKAKGGKLSEKVVS